MTRTTQIAAAVLAALIPATLIAATNSGGAAAQATARASHPNVVVFMLDDANVEDIEYMPKVQARLVAQGTTFTKFYSPNSLCCPARVEFLTGRYSHNNGVVDNVAPLGGFTAFDDDSTIATWLNGDYRTALIGKYLNQYSGRYVPPGWNMWKASPTGHTYDYMNQHLNVNGRLTDFAGIYSTTLFGNHSRAFLNGVGAAPFFLATTFVAPHTGTPREAGDPQMASPYVDARYRNTYVGPLTPTDTSVNEADMSDKRSSHRNPALLTPSKLAQVSEVLAQRRESLRSVDDQIAATMDKVAAIGEADDTYYILLSDNGYMQGQHRQPAGKGKPWEADSRVPLVIAGPNVPAGATATQVTGLQDIAPTILSMTNEWGSQHGASIDGTQLLQFIHGATSGKAQLLEDAVTAHMSDREASELGAYGPRPTVAWAGRAIIRNDGWKLISYPQTGEVELYDLNTDPYEEQNLARDPAYDAKQAKLANRLATLKVCSGVGCRG